MKLADEITVRLDDGEVLHLRPTLRAAFRLEQRYGGFEAIIRGIADCSLTVMADVVNETANRRTAFADFLRHVGAMPLQHGVECLVDPLITLTLALAGVDDEQTAEPREAAKQITFQEHHYRLFQIATGWLGWTPTEVWGATPSEIVAAYKGRIDMLASIFGGDDAQPEGESKEMSRDEFRAFVAAGGNLGC